MRIFARPCPTDPELEEIFRTKAHDNLVDFITYTNTSYMPDLFHERICDILQSTMSNPEPERIMIFAPPQHGKSEIVSVRFPAYWLGHKPKKPVIITSYGAMLAQSKSTQAKSIMESYAYQYIFKELFKNNPKRAIKRNRTMITSAGVGGPITGFGAGLAIIDDPVKNYEEALSPAYRERVWSWYLSTFRTRVWEGGKVIIIMTRWHEDDLCGRLLNDQGDKWKIYRFPAIAETQETRDLVNHRFGLEEGLPDLLDRKPGEGLAPHRYRKGTLLEIREEIGERTWASEYQGFPQAPGGNMFKEHWFELIDYVPDKVQKRVRYWDKAATEGGGARSSGVRMSFDGRFWIIEDIIKGQWSTWQREEIMKQVAEADDEEFGQVEVWLETEGGSAGKDSSYMSTLNLAGHIVKTEHPFKAKEIRATPFATQAEAGHVRMVKAPWNKAFLAELTMFPNSTYKDQVDAAAGAFNKLIRRSWVRPPVG